MLHMTLFLYCDKFNRDLIVRSSQIIKKIESKQSEPSISVDEIMRVMNFARSRFHNVDAQGKFMADYLISLHRGKSAELEAQAKPQEEHKEEDCEPELVDLDLQASVTPLTPSPHKTA